MTGLPRGGAFAAIVEAAVDLFHEHGYEATSVQQVVERARVTKGAFYHHFAAKEDLLLLIHATFIDRQLDVLRAAVSRGRPAKELLALVTEEILVGAGADRRYQTIFFEHRRFLSGDRFTAVQKKREEFEQLVVDIIESGIADGSFRRVPSARVLAFGLIGMSAWAYQWYRPGGMTPRDIGRLYADTVLHGLATERPPAGCGSATEITTP